MLAATIDFIGASTDDPDRRAGDARVAVDRPSTLRAPAQAPIDVAIEDLSARGFRFRSDAALPIGTRVRIGLCGAGVQDARIVRRDGDAFGCAFLEPLSVARMATAFSAAAVVQGPFAGAAAFPPPARHKWPPAARLTVLIGGSVALWACLLGGAALLLG